MRSAPPILARVAAVVGLACPFASCASALAGAELARAMAPAARIDSLLKLTIPRELDDPIFSKVGLELESSSLRKQEVVRAHAYARYRADDRPAARARFAAACALRPSDPYCAMESARFASGVVPVRSEEKHRKAIDRFAILSDLKSGNFNALKSRPVVEVAIGAASFESFEEMKSAAQAATSFPGCDSGESALVLAGKGEEFFPAKNAVDAVLNLYEKAGACASASGAAKARYRFAMIAIWQNRCADADSALEALDASQAGYAFRSRARFWRLHCARQLGKAELAEAMQQALITDHPLSFHNLAVNGADPAFLEKVASSEIPKAAMRTAVRPEANPTLRAFEALILTGHMSLAGEAVELLSGQMAALEPEARLYVVSLMGRAQQGLAQFRLLAQLFQERPRWIGPETLRLYFPLWYFDEVKRRSGDVDPLLLVSLIRQESGFNARATSSVGARGLMQLMPATARSFASIGKHKLFDPLINMSVGTRYFRKSLERFEGDVELTLASYNAGGERAARWSKRYPVDNRLLFLDLIPFKETRDYVSAILRNYYWYNELYGEGRRLMRGSQTKLANLSQPMGRAPAQEAHLSAAVEPATRVVTLNTETTWPSAKTRAILEASALAAKAQLPSR